MTSAREIYEQRLNQQRANEEASRKATQDAENASITAENKRNEAAQQILQKSGIRTELNGLSEVVQDGHVHKEGSSLELISNQFGYSRDVVRVTPIIGTHGETTGFDINGVKATTQEEVSKAMAEAALHPKREKKLPGIEPGGYTFCDSSPSGTCDGCVGGC